MPLQYPQLADWYDSEAASKEMGEPMGECRGASSAIEPQRQGSTLTRRLS
jgi:hypothetical protein